MESLLVAADQAGAKVFLDEAYIEFAELDESDWFNRPGVVCLRTFSKAFGLAGARVGYLLGDAAWLNVIRGMTMPFNVSTANLQLAAQAWACRDQLAAYCRTIAQNRERVADYLSAQGMARGITVNPSKGNFVLIRVSAEWKQLIASVMKKQGIQIKTALGGLPYCLRITIPYDVKPVMAALKAIFEPVAMAFDMDGVLIDTSLSYDLAIVDTVKSFTGQTVSIEAIVEKRSQGGFNNDWVLAQAMIADLGQSETLQTVTDVFQGFYLGADGQRGRFNDEVNLLRDDSTLFGAGKKCAVVTGRPKFEAKQGVKQLGVVPDHVVSLDDVKNGKPDPEGILWLQQQWQINAEQGMYFTGDNVDDMQAGNAAGCICVGIAGGSASQKDVLYQAGADVVLDNINQLEELFQ